MTSAYENTKRLHTHLEDLVEEKGGTVYTKSKFLARGLDLSSKEVAAGLRSLRDDSETLTIEQWGSSTPSTWMITKS